MSNPVIEKTLRLRPTPIAQRAQTCERSLVIITSFHASKASISMSPHRENEVFQKTTELTVQVFMLTLCVITRIYAVIDNICFRLL
jgi:hypothetical protein